jgi:acetyl esterase/lipase
MHAGSARHDGERPTSSVPLDVEGWHALVKMGNEMMMTMMASALAEIVAEVEQIEVEGAPVYVITPEEVGDDDPCVYLEVHGGGLTLGGGDACRGRGLIAANRVGARTYAVDYRMPPDDPYPAGLDDCVATYRAMLRDHPPEEIIVGGWSAGGNLAAALILRARDEGLPLPAAAALLSPMADLTESGDSFRTNRYLDAMAGSGGGDFSAVSLLYAGGEDLAHPYLSPLFGDFTKGFPPTILAAGTRDLFLSNTVRMHRALRAAGVAAELHIMEAGPHGGFRGAAEDHDLEREVRRFVDERWGRAR